MKVKRKDNCHFNSYRKLNGPHRISFVILKFGFDRKNLQSKKVACLDQFRLCRYQSAFDFDNDCGGTHRIDDICMEVGISNRFGWGSRKKELPYIFKTR